MGSLPLASPVQAGGSGQAYEAGAVSFDFEAISGRTGGLKGAARSKWGPNKVLRTCKNGYSMQQNVKSAIAAESIVIKATPMRLVKTGRRAEKGSLGRIVPASQGHIYS